MFNDHVPVARGIAAKLGETERTANASLRAASELLLTTIDARSAVGGSLDRGRAAMLAIGESIAHFARAQEAMFVAHAAFSVDRDAIGLTPRMSGCTTATVGDTKGEAGLAAVA